MPEDGAHVSAQPFYTGDKTHHQDESGEVNNFGITSVNKNFITKYIFSTDHKIISKQFMFTAIFWAIIGGFLSIVFRLQLGFPNQSFPFMETLFGKWAPGGIINPDFYYKLVTMHGTVLLFFVLTSGLSGTFANLLIPLQIGARDMASPFLNMLSYWFFFLASCIMIISFFLPEGSSDLGWTMYAPMSAIKESTSGAGSGADFWLISLVCFIISTLLGGLNYTTTVLNLRTKGMSMKRLPLTVWALLLTAILGILSFPVLLGTFTLLLADRNLGTSFFINDIFINGHALGGQSGGNALLYQHLFWFLGHPEVYIVILPAFGIVSEIISINARKPIFGYHSMVLAMVAITVLSLLVWAHHMFVSGMNPFVASVFVMTTTLIAVPSAIKVFNWLGTLWKGDIHFTPAMLFAIGFVSMFISGGLTGIYLGNSLLDIELHDTYFVVAHFHIVMGVSSVFGMFAGIYHWFPKMFGRHMSRSLGTMHFWLSFAGSYLIFWPMYYIGLAGVPRRYYSFDAFKSFIVFDNLNKFITVAAILVFIAQLIFIGNFFFSIFFGRKIRERNPWKANTLEWTTEIVPGHGNWKELIPTVHRWPYDYSKNGSEYIPQTQPSQQWEKEVQ